MYDYIEIIRNTTNNQLIKPYFKVGFTIIQNFYRPTIMCPKKAAAPSWLFR